MRVGADVAETAATAAAAEAAGEVAEDVEAAAKIASVVAARNKEAAEERKRRREQECSSERAPRPTPPRGAAEEPHAAQPATSTRRRLKARASKDAYRRKLTMLDGKKQKAADGDFAKFTQLSRHAAPSLEDPIDLENLPSVQRMKGLLARNVNESHRRRDIEERRIARALFV